MRHAARYSIIILSSFLFPVFFLFLFIPHLVFADCGASISAPSNLKIFAGPRSGQLTLWWNPAWGADRYSIVYGTKSNEYSYSAINFGNSRTRSFTVGYLKLNFKYFFRVQASNGCDYSPWSNEVSAWPPSWATLGK